MPFTNLSKEQIEAFHNDGYIIIKNFCSHTEIQKLYSTAVANHSVSGNLKDLNASFQQLKPSLWFTPNNDVFGYLSRSEKVVDTMARLLEGDAPVCHIQSKLMQKKPGIGGVWEWHQDYAYWSQNKFMKANKILSIMLSLTGTSKESGCSLLIRGSHKLNRIKHGFGGDWVGADMEKVNLALESMELIYVEVDPGDAVFFHSNLLHRADANLSDESCWSIVSCYSAQTNLAHKPPFTSWYTPVKSVPNDAILHWDKECLEIADWRKNLTPAL